MCTSFSEPDATNVSEPDGFRLKMSTCQCCEYESIGFLNRLTAPAVAAVARASRPQPQSKRISQRCQCAALTTVGAKANATRNTPRGSTVQCSAATNHRFVQPQRTNAVAVRCRARVALRTHRRRRVLHGRVYRSEALPACGTPALVSLSTVSARVHGTARHSTACAGRRVGLRTDSAVATLLMNEYRCG